MSKNKNSVDYEIILMIVTVIGCTTSLLIHTSNQIDAIHKEMKEFHTTLEVQDREFKMRLCAIEENKK